MLAVFVVDRTDDTNAAAAQVCSAAANDCSLRGAITAANATGAADEIQFAASTNGTPFTLTLANAGGLNEDGNATGDLDATAPLTITGNGESFTIIQAGTNDTNGIDKVLALNPLCDAARAFTISDVTIRFGRNTQIFNAPDFSFTGGGVDFCGTGNAGSSLTITDTTISDNKNVNGYGGGLNIDEVAPATSTVTITNSTITSNESEGTGGGINIIGDNVQVTITGSTISDNETVSAFATGSTGGGVEIRPVNINNSDGAPAPTVTITHSTISGNSAAGLVGGGGIAVAAGGAHTVNLHNITVSGNSALADGGGILFDNSSVTLTAVNATITNNRADSDNSGGLDTGGGINKANGTLNLRNTIVAGNFVDPGSTIDDIIAPGVNADFSLIGNTTGAGTITGANNQLNVDPLLGPLADNGGGTLTHALTIDSPALDNGSNALATGAGLTTDQRGTGFARSSDAADVDATNEVDIGAYEAHPTLENVGNQFINTNGSLVLNFNVGDDDLVFDSVIATSSNATLVPNNPANISISGSGSTRTVTVTPAANQSGTTTITLTVNDTLSGSAQSMSDTFILTVSPVDFGDAPDPTYPTLLSNNGARHDLSSTLRLGSLVDAEPDGLPTAGATGDDTNGSDDENGVVISPNLVPGQTATVDVVASEQGVLNAWIDFNANGSWADAGEQIASDLTLAAGLTTLSFTVPLTATTNTTTYARFRLNSSGGLSFTGGASDGEVEDHALVIRAADADKIAVKRGNHFFLDANGNGQWNTYAGGDRQLQFGGTGDVAISGDWDGNGVTEIGVYRSNQFYLDINGNGVWDGAGTDALHTFLTPGVPVIGDWDGDGDDQIGVWQAGVYSLDLNGNGTFDGTGGGDLLYAFGLAGDVPIAGNWDGLGADEIGAQRGNQFLLDANGDGISNVGDLQYTFGLVGDLPVAGDWDGDGIDEIGVVRNGTFFLDANGSGGFEGTAGGDLQQAFGNTGDQPLIGHWSPLAALALVTDTDRLGLRRGSTFFLDANGNGALNAGTSIDRTFSFGIASDIGIAGDWDGDGFDEIGIYRGNQFWLDANGNGVWDGVLGGDRLHTFRNVGDVPLIGDWDGDGDDNLGTWNAGFFYLDLNGNNVWDGGAAGDVRYTYGLTTDTPLAGDWDGDGADEIGVHRGFRFYLDASGNGVWNGQIGGDIENAFGVAGDVPVTGDWDGDGSDEIGVQRSNVFHLDRSGNGVWDNSTGGDLTYTYGDPGDQPLHGKWEPVSPSFLMADGGPAEVASQAPPLTADALAPILQQATILWTNYGLSAAQSQMLAAVRFEIADLPGAQLGVSSGGTVTLDADAAGYGWFVDPTPADNSEFESGSPSGMDLLSTVLHELGHELGFDHDSDIEAMHETLAAGTRRLL